MKESSRLRKWKPRVFCQSHWLKNVSGNFRGSFMLGFMVESFSLSKTLYIGFGLFEIGIGFVRRETGSLST